MLNLCFCNQLNIYFCKYKIVFIFSIPFIIKKTDINNFGNKCFLLSLFFEDVGTLVYPDMISFYYLVDVQGILRSQTSVMDLFAKNSG